MEQVRTHFQISANLERQEMLIAHDQTTHENFWRQTIELLNSQRKSHFRPSHCVEHTKSLSSLDELLRIQVGTKCFAVSSSLDEYI